MRQNISPFRLLVHMCITATCPMQVGCVLGKGGSIVTRVRDSTGAMVRVLEQNKGQRRLESGEEVDEVIEIQGLPQSCDSALQAVADLLRQYQVLSSILKICFDQEASCLHWKSRLSNALGQQTGVCTFERCFRALSFILLRHRSMRFAISAAHCCCHSGLV